MTTRDGFGIDREKPLEKKTAFGPSVFAVAVWCKFEAIS